jgi:hypothetical protein
MGMPPQDGEFLELYQGRASKQPLKLTFLLRSLTISPCPRVHASFWSDVAAPMRLGRPKESGGLGPADDAHAQEGGGPVNEGKHGSVEVASS